MTEAQSFLISENLSLIFSYFFLLISGNFEAAFSELLS